MIVFQPKNEFKLIVVIGSTKYIMERDYCVQNQINCEHYWNENCKCLRNEIYKSCIGFGFEHL